MSWIIFTLLTAVIWSFVNIVDKHVIGHEFRDPIVATVLKNAVMFAVLTLATIIAGQGVNTNPLDIILLMIAGALVSSIVYYYYRSLSSSDVSNVVPVFSTRALFTLVLGAAFLGERFETLTYAGIFLLVLGAVMISVKSNGNKRFTLNVAIGSALLVAVFAAIRSVLVKFVVEVQPVWPFLFWIGLGMALTTVPILMSHHRHVKAQMKKRLEADIRPPVLQRFAILISKVKLLFHAKKPILTPAQVGIEHLVVNDVFDSLGYLSLLIAISLGPVTLVNAVLETRPLMVFILATLLSVFYPSYLKEELTVQALAKKFVGTLLVIGGVILVAT